LQKSDNLQDYSFVLPEEYNQAVTMTQAYLRADGDAILTKMAAHMGDIAEARRVFVGEYEGFLATHATAFDGSAEEALYLSIRPEYGVNVKLLAARLAYEIGATARFNRSAQENALRMKRFMVWYRRNFNGSAAGQDTISSKIPLLSPITGKAMNIVIVSPEVIPFAKSGGLAEVPNNLARTLRDMGLSPVVFTLKYKNTNAAKLTDTGLTFMINIRGHEFETRIWKGDMDGVPAYLLENCYTEKLYEGNTLRQSRVLSEGTLRAIEVLHAKGMIEKPDVIQGNDWQTALIPLYLKTNYINHPLFFDTASVFTIHSMLQQGRFSGSQFDDIGVGGEHYRNGPYGLIKLGGIGTEDVF